jgi:hypothetical protein
MSSPGAEGGSRTGAKARRMQRVARTALTGPGLGPGGPALARRWPGVASARPPGEAAACGVDVVRNAACALTATVSSGANGEGSGTAAGTSAVDSAAALVATGRVLIINGKSFPVIASDMAMRPCREASVSNTHLSWLRGRTRQLPGALRRHVGKYAAAAARTLQPAQRPAREPGAAPGRPAPAGSGAAGIAQSATKIELIASPVDLPGRGASTGSQYRIRIRIRMRLAAKQRPSRGERHFEDARRPLWRAPAGKSGPRQPA